MLLGFDEQRSNVQDTGKVNYNICTGFCSYFQRINQ